MAESPHTEGKQREKHSREYRVLLSYDIQTQSSLPFISKNTPETALESVPGASPVRAGMAPPRPGLHRGFSMAAPSEGRAGRAAASFPGTDSGSFPFSVPHGAAGEPSKKPCRACTDFKSWLREQRKQAAPGSAVRRGGSPPWNPGGPQFLQSSVSPPSCPPQVG